MKGRADCPPARARTDASAKPFETNQWYTFLPMDDHTLRVLEFPKVRELVMEKAVTEPGREAARDMRPFASAAEAQMAQREVTEAVQLIETNETIPFDGVYDIRDPLRRCAVPGAMLEPGELIVIGETVAAASRMHRFFSRVREKAPSLAHYGAQLARIPEIEDAVRRVFDEHGAIRDSASHELSRVRKTIRAHRERLVSRLEKAMRGKYRDYLQESYYTQRDGRYVLPVDARYQSKVGGIIHDRSSTGTTVFIEPIEFVEDGNRLKELQREEEMECRRILLELTSLVAGHRDSLIHNMGLFQHLDLVYAKARFSVAHNLLPPVIVNQGRLYIRDGYHPLLLVRMGRANVVPFTLDMRGGLQGVVVTGPNTGGKTVILKTAGLLTLMALCGMHIPARDDSEIPAYTYIGADIGDEQSLEQSLSTFSSHMSHIREIVEAAGPGSLVLLDELGSGTDPLEGGPLASAILEELMGRGAAFLVTSHLHDLKLFAHKREGVENAALEFDFENLCPTYAFRLGLPGQSNAIHIARRLGLPETVIGRARALLKSKGDSPEHLLKELGEELRSARRVREEANQSRLRAEELRGEAENRVERSKNEAREILKRSEKKAQGLISELERRLKSMEKQQLAFEREWEEKLNNLVRESRPDSPPGEVIKKLRGELESFKRETRSKDFEARPKEKRQPWSWRELRPGCRVRVSGFSGMGVARTANEARDVVEVSINALNLRVPSSQVLAVFPPMNREEKVYQASVSMERPADTKMELDIHGMTTDDMIPVVQQYVDRAFRCGMPSVRIVHGHGTGRLRRAVRQLLGTIPVVRHFRNGEDFEGGNGVTVVEFKRM